MKKLMLTLAVFILGIAQANDLPKTGTIAFVSNATNAVTSITIGDTYKYSKDIDAVLFTVSGKTDTNKLLVATIGQPIGSLTNTVWATSTDADVSTLIFPRNFIATNCVERFCTAIATLSCSFVWATNTSLATVSPTNITVSATITTK